MIYTLLNSDITDLLRVGWGSHLGDWERAWTGWRTTTTISQCTSQRMVSQTLLPPSTTHIEWTIIGDT